MQFYRFVDSIMKFIGSYVNMKLQTQERDLIRNVNDFIQVRLNQSNWWVVCFKRSNNRRSGVEQHATCNRKWFAYRPEVDGKALQRTVSRACRPILLPVCVCVCKLCSARSVERAVLSCSRYVRACVRITNYGYYRHRNLRSICRRISRSLSTESW